MRLEALPSAISIADDHLDACLVGQLPEVLLDGILREAIADGKDANNAVLLQAVHLRLGRKAETKQE